jgi:hypothetical protein
MGRDMTDWQKQRSERDTRLNAGSRYASGKMVQPESAKALLDAVIRPGDRVCLEGDNQKQADFLAEVLAALSRKRRSCGLPGRVGCLHGSALLLPAPLPAADHPARDLAIPPVHPELPRR